ncbi:MAG: DNA-binding transcriptional regulator [Kiritimatiellae bacterium]|nr:DNA-binding transcriptional regulator [Kiritimatiellia bacterium]
MAERTRAYGRRLCEGVAEYAQKRGDWVLIPLDSADLAARNLRKMDGFIVRTMDDTLLRALQGTGKPVVDALCRKPLEGVAVVDADHEEVAHMAAEHFLEHHFTSFAYCGCYGEGFSDARREAFVQALRRAGHTCECYTPPPGALHRFDDAISRCERISSGGDSAALRKWLLALPPRTAVFCCHDRRACQVLRICRACGIDVPQRIAILGVDNDTLLCSFASPMISSIEPDAHGAGFRAADVLQRMMDEPELCKCPPRILVMPRTIAVRASSEVYPLDPPWLSDALVFIRRNVARRISATDVFERIGKSHSLVESAFRNTLSTTVQREIMKSRIEEAQHLLKTTDLSVVAVAARAGFNSSQYFCRSFAAANGMPPDAYRRQFARKRGEEIECAP